MKEIRIKISEEWLNKKTDPANIVSKDPMALINVITLNLFNQDSSEVLEVNTDDICNPEGDAILTRSITGAILLGKEASLSKEAAEKAKVKEAEDSVGSQSTSYKEDPDYDNYDFYM